MKKITLFVVALAGFLAAGAAFLVAPAPVDAAATAKNLKVLPPDMPIPEVKKIMKTFTAALGVQCDFCHNTDDMSQDTDKKNTAREMLTMTMEINKAHFSGKPRVGCITCHNGAKEPKGPEQK
jgi:hypothetical protein